MSNRPSFPPRLHFLPGKKPKGLHTPLKVQTAILMMDRPRYCCQGQRVHQPKVKNEQG